MNLASRLESPCQQILDDHTAETFPNLLETVNHFQGGLAHDRRGAWDDATRGFTDALRLNPHDQLSTIYLDRCAQLKAHPPEGEWNGVWVMKSK